MSETIIVLSLTWRLVTMTEAENWRTRNWAGLAVTSPATSSAWLALVWLTGTVNWENENSNWEDLMNKRDRT